MTPKQFTTICDQFFVPNIIRNHLLRVSAIALQITKYCNKELNKNLIRDATLLHDIGNIVKSNVHRLSAYEEKSEDFWAVKQKEIIEKYGRFDDEATANMLKEIDIPEQLRRLISTAKNDKVWDVVEGNDWNAKICLYADYRAGPASVLTLQERFDDLERRYKQKPPEFRLTDEEAKRVQDGFRALEKQLFEACDSSPDDISEESIQKFLLLALIPKK
ncbi:HD domain-containing protein [Candidatus Woesearchaeota archaeon]|nr:HD domain-containing protein [Candidatus Woesearchaeota archaeon]